MQGIQYINYTGDFKSNIFKVNKLSSPESFDDYEINIIDLSQSDVWKYTGNSLSNINCLKDITTLSSMIKNTKNKIMVILPQNILYKYNWGYVSGGRGNNYTQSTELKNNIQVINFVIDSLTGANYKNSWLMYNKTKSKIQSEFLTCDFVFQKTAQDQQVLFANNGTSVTMIKYLKLFLTTLKIETEQDLLNIIREIGWDSSFCCECPEWFPEIDFLNDKELHEERNNVLIQIDTLKQKQLGLERQIDSNNFYKSILYKTGQELVDVVNLMLKDMVGYNYEDFKDVKEEDFLFEIEGTYYIGEIKGISSNVKRSNVLQTAMHKTIFLEAEGNENKKVNAIAIINRQKSLSPNKRDPITHDVEKLAKATGVLLITAEDLLNIYENFKNKKLSFNDIIVIFNQSGLFKQKRRENY